MSHLLRMLRFGLFGSAIILAAGGSAFAQTRDATTSISQPMQLAQLFDWGHERGRDRGVRVYTDEYGRQITVDRRGRVLHVEDPRDSGRYASGGQQDGGWSDGPVGGGALMMVSAMCQKTQTIIRMLLRLRATTITVTDRCSVRSYLRQAPNIPIQNHRLPASIAIPVMSSRRRSLMPCQIRTI